MDKYKIKNLLLSTIQADSQKQAKLNEFFKRSSFNNGNELLDKVIFDNKPAAIVIIDEATDELYNVMGQLTMTTEVLEAQTYVCGAKKLHRFQMPAKSIPKSPQQKQRDLHRLPLQHLHQVRVRLPRSRERRS